MSASIETPDGRCDKTRGKTRETVGKRRGRAFRKAIVYASLASFLVTTSQPSFAALTDLAGAPLASTTTAQVKPNVMYLMDTSGSMAWGHMPDSEETYITSVGYKSSQCNTLFYNPNITYTLPKKADGTDYATPSFAAAPYDGYSGSTTTNLSSSFKAYDANTLSGSGADTAQAAYYYKYTSGASVTQALIWHAPPCTMAVGTSPFLAAGDALSTSATSTLAPATPGVTITNNGTTAGSLYTAALAGNYKYRVTSFNTLGESAPTALSSAVAVTAGQGVKLVISDNGGTPAALGYGIYRTAAGGSTATAFITVARATSNGAGLPTTTVLELNDPGTWTKVLVSGTAEQQNFTNWYSYYRTRILMMKSAASRAFNALSSSYRVGFVTINPGNPVSSSNYLPLADFTSAQRTAWYAKLFAQTPANSTPLREALSRVGRYYAGMSDGINSGMTPDPVQYSCQQNFTILTTDGYWNTGNETVGPVQINGTTAVGQQDADLSVTPPPMWDGGASSSHVTTNKGNLYTTTTTCTPNVLQVVTAQQYLFTQQRSQTAVTNYYVAQPFQETHATNYYFAQQAQRCSSSTNPCPTGAPTNATFSNNTTSSNAYSGSGGTAKTPDDGYLYYTCGTRQCRVLAAPAFTAPTYTGWTSAACPSDASGIHYACQTGPATSPVNVSACPANAGATVYTCAYAAAATFVPASPLSNGYTQGVTPANTTATHYAAQTTTVTTTLTGSCPASGSGITYTCPILTPSSVPAVPASPTNPTGVGYTTVTSGTSCPTAPAGTTNTCNTQSTTTTLALGSACPAAANAGQTVTCTTVPGTANSGKKVQYATKTYTQTVLFSGSTAIGNANPTPVVTGPGAYGDLDGICYPNNGAGMPSYPSTEQLPVPPGTPPLPPSGCTAWPCTTNTAVTSGGSSNSLADVAQFYYQTDLRPTMIDNVPSTGQGPEDDKATWQHMTTFTMGLGVPGTLTYRSDYKTATTGDFAQVRAGALGWPVPVHDDPTAIDDLWHAAVNGRGQYFSAGDPQTVVDGLTIALAGINARVASAAAAATSNLEPVAGDNFAYTAKYVTTKWIGELEAHQINLATGAVDSTVIWSAAGQLDAKAGTACDNRTIYLFRAGATNNRGNFTWNSDTCDSSGAPTGSPATDLTSGEQANFGAAKVALLTQKATMTTGSGSTVDQVSAAKDANLVNYLRGQRGKEEFVANDLSHLYRQRDHILGDIVNAQPVYVKAPFASYSDSGYDTYKSGPAGSRAQVVYVAANDGMLHAFDAVLGSELWAFMPSVVLPNLYILADENYANLHRYSVDGTPAVGDAYDPSAKQWKTILVAGLNGGGKGYYALDVTDPTNPIGLWEFNWSSTCRAVTTTATPMSAGATSDCHLGYTFNNPLITKLANGKWVVIVTSGYNNVNSPAGTGDGLGYLYVLDAFTGNIIYKISTGAGSAASPSGLNHIINWVENTLTDNTATRVYGVDIIGNVWRFDINDTILPAGLEATLIGTAKDAVSPTGVPQPITTRPEVAEVGGAPMIFVATGALLGASDELSTQKQSIYGIIDPMGATTAYADLRAALKPLTMTQVGTGSTATRTIACTGTTSQCGSTHGWVADLPESGERVNVDMKLQLGTLVVASNVPESSACTIGGHSWLNYLNFETGTAVANSAGQAVAQYLSDSLAVGLNIVRLPSDRTVVITTTSDAKQNTISAPFSTPPPSGRRVSWREIAQ